MTDTLASAVSSLENMGAAQYLALVIGASVACQWIAWRLRIPALLLLLMLGFGLGQFIRAEEVFGREVMFGGVTIAVGLILFEGSLSLRFRQLSNLGRPVIRLCTVTPMIAWPLITLGAWLIGFDIEIALLVGAILIVTGPTVINPILRTLRPTKRVSSLLRWEGIVVDPIGAVLAVLVYQGVRAGGLGDAVPHVAWTLMKTVIIALTLALLLGAVMSILMERHEIPDFLHGVSFVGVAVASQVISNYLQPESGLLTVTMLGIYLANRPGLHLHHVVEFTEHLQVLFVGAVVVVLAGRVTPDQLIEVLPRALIFVAILVLIVRPVSIWLGLWGTAVERREKTLLSAMAPRGIVAAAVTSIFALEFSYAAHSYQERADNAVGDQQTLLAAKADKLAGLAQQAEGIVPLIFLVIVLTVAIYGLGIGRLAERLGLASTTPQGVLFAGVTPWVVDAAQHITELGFPALVVDREFPALSRARMAGINTENVSILSDYAVEEMDVSGIGYLIACTHDEETNATACRQFVNVFGRANLYQLRRQSEEEAPEDDRRNAAAHLSGRAPFVPAPTYRQLADNYAQGMRMKRTSLSSEFTLRDFQAYYGEQAIIMFIHQGSTLQVARKEAKIPEKNVTLIAMVPDVD